MTNTIDLLQSDESIVEVLQSCDLRNPSTPPPRLTGRNWRKLAIITCLVYANFWMSASVALQAPFFPREAESKGATPSQYGVVFGVFELSVIVMSPIFGKLIPRVSPKFLVTFGVLLGGTSCCVFGLLDAVPPGKLYLALAFIVRIFEGMGAAAVMTASFTIISSTFPDNVATNFSVTETGIGFGLIIGPTIGGALFQVGGFLLPFIVNGGFLLLGSLPCAFVLPSIEDAEQNSLSRNVFRFLCDVGIIVYILSIVTSFLFIGFNAATLEPHLRQFNLSPVVLGVIFVVVGSMYALTTPVWGRIIDKGVNPLVVDIFGFTLTATGILFIGPASFMAFEPSLGTVIGSLVVIGLGLSAKLVSSFVGVFKRTISRNFPDNFSTYGMVSALFSSSCSIGAFIGPSLGGCLLEKTGYRLAIIVIFAVEGFSLLLLVVYYFWMGIKNTNISKANREREYLLAQTCNGRSYCNSKDIVF